MNPPPLPNPQKPSSNRLIFWLLVPLAVIVAGLVGAGVFIGASRAIKSQQAVREIRSTMSDFQADEKKSYNSKTGITNFNLDGLERVRDKLDSASGTLSGDDALVARAMSQYLGTMEDAAKKYHAAAGELRSAKVLSLGTLSDKAQIASRRETVQDFSAANRDFENIISNSLQIVRDDLAAQNVSQIKANAAIKGFQSKSAAQTPLVLKIRSCDDHMVDGMLGILDLLEQNWGKWNYDPVRNLVTFDDTVAQASYRQYLAVIKTAQQEQVRAQGQLVSLPP